MPPANGYLHQTQLRANKEHHHIMHATRCGTHNIPLPPICLLLLEPLWIQQPRARIAILETMLFAVEQIRLQVYGYSVKQRISDYLILPPLDLILPPLDLIPLLLPCVLSWSRLLPAKGWRGQLRCCISRTSRRGRRVAWSGQTSWLRQTRRFHVIISWSCPSGSRIWIRKQKRSSYVSSMWPPAPNSEPRNHHP